jgi:hypothetical protein
MNSVPSVFRVLGVVTILLGLAVFAATPASQAQMAMPAAPAAGTAQTSFCGNQPLCYEANDFAATITDFRTSTQGGYKVIDVIVRFQNKLNQPLALGYLAGSGTALDDRGNRYIVYGGNGFRGIGQVYGNSFDPKFSLRPGGFGDAQFELMWAPGQTVYGLTFELNLTVDEINTVEGNQHTLGGEFPLHYRGLSNGVTGGAPGQAFASQGQGTAGSIPSLPPCGTTATTLAGAANSSGIQVPASANTAVSNATTTFSNLGSLFKKKAAAPAPAAAPNTASAAAPCAPAATGAGTSSATTMTPGTTSMSPTGGTATQTAGAASSTAATPVAKAATTRNATAATTATTTAKPVAVVAKTPATQSNATVKKPVPPPAPQKPASTTTTTNQ